MSDKQELPYEGLKVIDLSQGVAGPHCGMLFAQYGADVVKVEPLDGDWGRAIGRQFGDFSAYNIAFNRGKRSLSVNLKSDQGLDIVRSLVTDADVVVENYRPGVLKRFGLDYDSVSATNHDVIYVSVTGFGQTGPQSGFPATDSILQSYSGLMSANRDVNGTPQRIGVLVIDVVTGLYGYQAAATALYKRATRGGGKHICLSLMESIGAVQAGKMIEFHLEGDTAKKPGVPVGTFQTADGFMTINARRDAHFVALCELLGCAELGSDSRFATATTRLDHEAELMGPLVERIRAWSSADLTRALAAHDILHATVNDYSSYFAEPHVQQSNAIQWLEHPETGVVPIHSIPGVPAPAPDTQASQSPANGQHTTMVLQELGWSDSQIAAAADAGAVFQAAS